MVAHLRISILAGLLFALMACASPPPTSVPPDTPATTPTSAPTAVPDTDTAVPQAVEYNLGEVTIVQERFPEDSRFRHMPVQLNGIIAAPPEGDGPYPVVLIIHGTHPGCPVNEMSVDVWPCAPEVEQPNYRGFDYLISHLAAQGYVALSINANAENTFGFGEGTPGERLSQLVGLHLDALVEAVNGGENQFGVELDGRADLTNLAFFGHSRGGDGVVWLAHRDGLTEPDAAARHGYGPVKGLLLIAPTPAFTLPNGANAPMAILLPACDGDVITQDGQYFYEGARQNPTQSAWATSVWLEQANHNYFNSILAADWTFPGRPDCVTRLDKETQRGFLTDYATDFLTAVFSDDAQAVDAAMAQMGLDVQTPAPDTLFGLPGRVSFLSPAADRQTLFIPASADELTTNRVGGAVTAEGVTTFFCEAGFHTPAMIPGSEPCRRVNLTIPGNPSLVVVSWEQPGGALRFALPEEAGDLSDYTTLSLRTAVDPLSPLNETGAPQAFSVQLTDRAGGTAVVSTRANEPALVFPPGEVEEDSFSAGDLFTGRAPMTTIRWQLSDFAGVDLSQIVEIALLFDQTESGSLFMGDVAWERPSASQE